MELQSGTQLGLEGGWGPCQVGLGAHTLEPALPQSRLQRACITHSAFHGHLTCSHMPPLGNSLRCSSFLSEPVSRWLGVLPETSSTREHAPPQPPTYPDACLHSLPTWVLGGTPRKEGAYQSLGPAPFTPLAPGR